MITEKELVESGYRRTGPGFLNAGASSIYIKRIPFSKSGSRILEIGVIWFDAIIKQGAERPERYDILISLNPATSTSTLNELPISMKLSGGHWPALSIAALDEVAVSVGTALVEVLADLKNWDKSHELAKSS